MKAKLFPTFFLLFFLSSCTIEDEFTELTSHRDFIIDTVVFLEDPDEDFSIDFVYFQTDGYNNLTDKYTGYSGSSSKGIEIFSHAVKKYKKVGLKIRDLENIDYISVNFYEVGRGKDIYFQYHREAAGEFTLMYDFDTDTYEVLE